MAAAVAAAGDAVLEYMTGFGNEFQTEALPGALPALGNTPQVRLTLTPSLDSPCISSLRLIMTMTVQLALSFPSADPRPPTLLHTRRCREWRMAFTQSSCRERHSPRHAAKT